MEKKPKALIPVEVEDIKTFQEQYLDLIQTYDSFASKKPVRPVGVALHSTYHIKNGDFYVMVTRRSVKKRLRKMFARLKDEDIINAPVGD